ncbi:1-(5-phosphoribosyl)-5-[(5-phosphoribosylamino)methylideneamino]imidazole-4-carboxamide isomerase [Bacillus sp. 2205SS5-2]|uniref:1-(5-phosphoribosyl)-5-[(5- phosphoribosylamino)methylideneamino]imidazole-4- carboxamide isomerase n=1 Tax=Bacillus sp. 2205SS5-2 TaxID=3109031 RepID=UPI0030071F39
MSLTIYPAIDMLGGKCVRLQQGDYQKETIYGDILERAEHFVKNGAQWIHMVDLDGAKDGDTIHRDFVCQVANTLNVSVQVGGGIRSEADLRYYLDNGVKRVIIGSLAVSHRSLVKEWLVNYGDQIVIGLDAKDGYVATQGWQETSELTAIDLAQELVEAGAETFIFTDIATDGMLSGPNIEAVAKLGEVTGKQVIASGGVSSLADLKELGMKSNIQGAIVGKALYEKRFSLRDAIEVTTC